MITRLKNDMKQAMKNKEKEKLSTLRMLLATIETERGKQGLPTVEDFKDEDVIGFINRNIKALNQEIESLKNVGRDFSKQEVEKNVLMAYLPKQLTEEEVVKFVEQAVIVVKSMGHNFGQLMKFLSELKGKADMSLVSKVAKEKWEA